MTWSLFFMKALSIGGVIVLTSACGSPSNTNDGGNLAGTGGAAGTGEGGSGGQSATGGIFGSGGARFGRGGSVSGAAGTSGGGSGGQSETGGIFGSGGTAGSGVDSGRGVGGSDSDVAVACTDDGGVGLPGAARRCSNDSDCTIAIAITCCGVDLAIGEAKSEAGAYAGCLALPAGACASLGCAKLDGYSTDSGKTTPDVASAVNPIDWVVVRCSNGLCASDVAQPSCDGGACQPEVGSSSCSSSCTGGNDCPDRCSPVCAQGKLCCPWAGGACLPNDAGGCSGAQGYSCATPTAAGSCPNQCYP